MAVGQFNPHHCQQSVIATSSGAALYLWDLNSPLHPLQSLHTAAHSNQYVQSLSWSTAHPMHFASVGWQVTADVLLWDARDTNAPLVALPVAPASSPSATSASSSFVAFHPFNSYLVASSSDTAIRIYDLRYPTGSVDSFQSPLADSLGSLCWSQWHWRHLITGNRSQQVEVWSMKPTIDHSSVLPPTTTTTSSAERLTYRLQTKDKLVSALSTPFGHGLITHSAAHSELQLWTVGTRLGQGACAEESTASSTDITEVARLAGGPSAVRLIDWYLPAATNLLSTSSSVGLSDTAAPQLWTLCDDRTIRVYEIPTQVRHTCGEATEDDTDIAALSATMEKEALVASSSSLRIELSYCERTVPSFRYYSFSSNARSCAAIVSSSHPAHSLLLQITFPASYPSAAPPVFAVQPGSSPLFIGVDIAASTSFLHQLSAMCLPYVEQGQRCLLPVLTYLEQFVQDTVNRSPHIAADSRQSEEGKGTESRKKVRIEERRELRERKQQPLGSRKGVVSASTPSLTALSSSLSQSFRLSTSLTSPSPLEEDSSPAYSSAEHSDDDEAPSHDVSAASSSSAMQTMVEEDEETAAEGEGSDGQQVATQGISDSKKRKEERDFELLCPRLCGVSWGPRGELVMFNNFPALTHYIQQTKEQRRLRAARKQQPLSTGGEADEKVDGALSIEARTHHRHTSFVHDHDEDDWDDMNQADVEPPPAISDESSVHQPINTAEYTGESSEQTDRTMDVFPPRTFGHLLQLPFLASYLEPVIREATDAENGREARASIRVARTEDRDEATDAIGMATVSLGAALAVEQGTADGSSSDSDDEQTTNLNAAPLSSLAAFSAPSVQYRSHARVDSNTSSIESVSPAHSRHASSSARRAASSSPPHASTLSLPTSVRCGRRLSVPSASRNDRFRSTRPPACLLLHRRSTRSHRHSHNRPVVPVPCRCHPLGVLSAPSTL